MPSCRCITCGKSLEYKTKRCRYCRECYKKHKREYMRAWIQNHRGLWNQYQRNYYNKKIRRKRSCVVCGSELKGKKTKYCDQICRDLANREKDIERKKKWNRAHPHKFLGTHAPEASLTLVKDELGRIRVKGALILKRSRYMRINREDTSKTD